MKFLGTALDIPAATTASQAVRKGYVDSADAALSARVAVLEGGGGQTLAVRSVNVAATAAVGDFILADASSAALTITLPATPATNTSVAIKKVDASLNLVTVVGSSGATVDGDATLTLLQAQSGAVLVFDGTNWRVESTVIFDPGAKNFTYRSTWNSGVTYAINDVVFFSGGAYVAILASTNTAPVVNTTTATWGLLVQQGATGPPGANAAAGYRHDQSTPATVWQITHGLGFDPAGLTVISDDGYTIDGGGVQYLTPGQSLRLSFDISIAGTAYLS